MKRAGSRCSRLRKPISSPIPPLHAQRSSGIPSVMQNADDDRRHTDWTAKGRYDLQLPTPRRSIEAQNQYPRCKMLFQDHGTHASSVSGILAHAPELQTPLPLQVARTPPWALTVNGVSIISTCIITRYRSLRRFV